MRIVLRATAALLTATLVALVTLAAPAAAATLAPSDETGAAAAAQPSTAKIVIIVGPTHGLTDSNREDANEAYDEAIKWTPNVYRYYSPNAIWSTIKPALSGANIVVYLGHGNGWPSPYTYDPNYTTKDGFGLNNPSNRSDNVVQYYGEPYIDDLALAPGAVVILNHACYSSGSSEPGNPEPSVSVAKQRVDNFGAAFIRAKASAVIAAYKGSAANYIRSLFTTSGTVFDAWRATAGYHDHEIAYASSRSSGKTAILDPDTAGGGGYNRSIVGSPGALVSTVVGQLPTDTDPSSFVVPGAAEVEAGGATLHASADEWSDEVGHLDEGTHVRLLNQQAWWGAEGSPDAWYEVEASDGTTGWARGYELIPRDSLAPGFFSLIANRSQMYAGQWFNLDITLSETAYAELRLRDPDGTTIASSAGTDNAFSLGWDGTIDGATAPNGRYTWTIEAVDGWGNEMPIKSGVLWFRDNSIPGTYTTLEPTRLLDTGLGIGMAAGAFAANKARTFAVAGKAGVPLGATAVTGVLRVLYPTKAGYVTISPLPDNDPPTATIHFVAGEVRATGVTMGLAPDGSLAVVYHASTGSTVRIVFEVTGYYVGNLNGARFATVEPTRLLDTGTGIGIAAGPFTANKARTFPVAGKGHVPGDATAVTGVLRVLYATKAGYVTLSPVPDDDPPTATIHFGAGQVVATGVTLGLASNGSLSVVYHASTGSSVRIVFEVTGYYVGGADGARYTTLEPTRLLDTGTGIGMAATSFTANKARTFPVAGVGGVPADATAVTGVLRVLYPTKAGYVTISPIPNDDPPTASIHFTASQIVATDVTTGLASNGSLSVVYHASPWTSTVRIVFEVTGYYR